MAIMQLSISMAEPAIPSAADNQRHGFQNEPTGHPVPAGHATTPMPPDTDATKIVKMQNTTTDTQG